MISEAQSEKEASTHHLIVDTAGRNGGIPHLGLNSGQGA